jgi:hypothetical protein
MVIDGAPMPPDVAVWRGMPGDGPTAFDPGGMLQLKDDVGFRVFHRGFDATHLAELLKVETGAEARQLAQNAVDANAAAQKAALAGNVAEASRQSRITNDLATAVQDVAELNHPELRRATLQMRAAGIGQMPR